MKKDEFGDYTEAAAKVRVLAGTLCAPCVSRLACVCVLCVVLCACSTSTCLGTSHRRGTMHGAGCARVSMKHAAFLLPLQRSLHSGSHSTTACVAPATLPRHLLPPPHPPPHLRPLPHRRRKSQPLTQRLLLRPVELPPPRPAWQLRQPGRLHRRRQRWRQTRQRLATARSQTCRRSRLVRHPGRRSRSSAL